jgi:eukaryotic-like serine/threonine-protein kinase
VSSAPSERIAEHFDRLLALAPDERTLALAAIASELGAEIAGRLRALLAADADCDDPLARAIVAAAVRTTPTSAAPQRLGPYRVLHEVGAGGMGTVFLGERADGSFEQQVAIKLMRGFPTRDGVRRLRQERQILATLDHPNIARLLDGGETEDGQPYLVMEYVPGVPITRYVAAHASDRAARLAMFDTILAAVQHAHQRLVVHRDLKPGNVLVRNDGTPKLLDFGVAKLIEVGQDDATPQTSTQVSTPGYASPEQLAGGMVTTASDVYGLGVLLRELLIGTRDERTRVTDNFPVLPLDAELRGVIVKATDPEPARRYATAQALREDLQRYREGRPLRAARDTRWYRARKFAWRHRIGLALIGLALAALFAFVVRLDVERRRALDAESRTATALNDAQRESTRAGAINSFLVSLFQNADPGVRQGERIDARMLLERGAARVESELEGQPELRAAMLEALALALRGLGEHERAEALLQKALAATPTTQVAALLRAQRLSLLASVQARRGAARDALSTAQAGLAALETAAGRTDELRVSLLNTVAMTQKYLDHPDEAAAALEQVLALLPELGAGKDEHRASALDNLAHVRESQGRWQEAVIAATNAEAEFAHVYGEHHPAPLAVAVYRANLLAMIGELDAASALMERALAAQRALLESDDRRLSNSETYLARIKLRRGDTAAAQPLIDAALARCEHSFAGSHTTCPLTVQLRGELFLAQGEGERALAQFREAVALRDADTDALPRARGLARHGLARGLCVTGHRDEGAQMLREVLPALLDDPHIAPGDKQYLSSGAQVCVAQR